MTNKMMEICSTEEIQRILLESLCYFNEFCRKHNLQFFLSNGTLLGAVKYSGFIPWDDDIDIMMPRKDYDKLLSMAKKIDSDKYTLLCTENVPGWKMPYAKLIRTDTVLKEGNYNFGVDLGVFVDIFPLDRWHPNRTIARMQAFFGELKKRFFVCSLEECFVSEKQGAKRMILYCIWLIGKMLGTQKALAWIQSGLARTKKYKNKYVGCVAWTCHGVGEVLPADVFAKAIMVPFCDGRYPVPAGYVTYLNQLYGQWMNDLPKDEQKSNHKIQVWWKYE